MEKKELLGSQRELLFLRRAKVEQAQAALQNALTIIAQELGIPENEQWTLNTKAEFFFKEKVPKKKD